MKKPKNYQKGVAPIYLRITVNGKFMKPIQLMEADETITAESLRNKFQGKTKKRITLIDVFKDHNQKMESLVDSEFKKGTAERYRTSLKHTMNFLAWKYDLVDIEIKKIDYTFISEYDYYLRSVRKCANNSAVKYLKNFGKIIRICLSNGWLNIDPFLNYKPKVKKVDRVYLSTKEIQLMTNKKMATERLTHVRDIFLFCCYTGLAYIDVKNLRRTDIVNGIDKPITFPYCPAYICNNCNPVKWYSYRKCFKNARAYQYSDYTTLCQNIRC